MSHHHWANFGPRFNYSNRITNTYDFSTDTSGLKSLAGPLWVMALTPFIGGLFGGLGSIFSGGSNCNCGNSSSGCYGDSFTRSASDVECELDKLDAYKNYNMDDKKQELKQKQAEKSEKAALLTRLKKDILQKPGSTGNMTKTDLVDALMLSPITPMRATLIARIAGDSVITIDEVMALIKDAERVRDPILADSLKELIGQNIFDSIENLPQELETLDTEIANLQTEIAEVEKLGGPAAINARIAELEDQLKMAENYERASTNLSFTKSRDIKKGQRKAIRRIRKALKNGDVELADYLANKYSIPKKGQNNGWYQSQQA